MNDLEPVSKPLDEDHDHRDMDEGAVHFRVPFVARGDAAVVVKPGEEALDLPAPPVAAQLAPVLRGRPDTVSAVRADQFDLLRGEVLAQGVRIVGPVGDEALEAAGPQLRDRLLDESDFGRGCRRNVACERKTRAVRHHQKLCALAPFGGPDRRAPFFAGMNVASMNDSAHSICSASVSSAMKAIQMRSHVPSSSQPRRRRQQVEGLGYSLGSARQGAPVHRTQRMPSTHARSGARGRPPSGDDVGWGKKGWSLVHWSSVNRSFPRGMGSATSMPRAIANPYVLYNIDFA